MKILPVAKQWKPATQIGFLGSFLLCAFVMTSTVKFFVYESPDFEKLQTEMGESLTLMLLGPFFDQSPHITIKTALEWTLCIATLIVCTTSAMGAVVMVRAPDKAASRQVAGLLFAFAALIALRFFFSVLPDYQYIYNLSPEVFELTDVGLMLYLALGLPRFLVIFPRLVDTDSVHQTYALRPFLMRWSRRVDAENNLLRHWHAGLVSGKVLWLALIMPPAIYAVDVITSKIISFDAWGGIFLVLSAGVIIIYFLWGLPYAFASISHLHRFGTREERKRVAWLRAALLGLGIIALLSFVLPLIVLLISLGRSTVPMAGEPFKFDLETKIIFSFFLFWALTPMTTIVLVGVAVLNNGALDPRLTFTRVTLWSIMGLFVTLAFIALERYIAINLVRWLSLPPDSGAIAAGALIAATFGPIRSFANKQVERLANRWIPLDELTDGERLHCAVAISDLSGYTALSSHDERNAILQSAALSRQAGEIAQSQGGKLVKSLGDAVMMTFPDPSSALDTVKRLHAAFPAAARILGVDPLKLHTAIHFGEIVRLNDGDIFGQTVNITSRLVDAAKPGEIVISDDFFAIVVAREGFEFMGQHRFKNVSKPIGCHRLVQSDPSQ